MPPPHTERPLAGKCILITRAGPDAAALRDPLVAAGASVQEMPAIAIAPPEDFAPLDAALRHLDRYDWIVFASRHGVEALFDRLAAIDLPAFLPAGLRVAAVGPRTAEALEEHGVRVDRIPPSASAADLAATLHDDLDQKWILFPASDIARPELKLGLEIVGGWVNEVVAYRTVLPPAAEQGALQALRAGDIDAVALCSPSAVRNLVTLLDQGIAPLQRTCLACIGPTTAAAALDLGLHPAVVADTHTSAGLVRAITDFFEREP